MNSLIEITNKEINQAEVKTVNARELHSFLESRQDFSTWIKKRIYDYAFDEGMDFIRFHKKMEGNNANIIEYFISIDMAKELSMVERNEKGREARKYFIECEKIAKSKNSTLNVPKTFAEALRLAATLEEEKERITLERDHAIKTKAEIGSRREATAMATASTAVRKANQLQKKLDQSQEYATVKRMEMIHHGIKFNWRILKKASEELNYPPIDVFDQNYGTVKGWHRDAWKKAYAITIEEIN